MSSLLHDVASAVLPVAIELFACAAVARAVLWSGFGDAQSQLTARRYLEPLCAWCLGASAVYAFARTAAGGSLTGSFGLGIVLGAAALVLWFVEPQPGRGRRVDSALQEEPSTPTADAPVPPPAEPRGAADRPLWAGDPADGQARTGLWGLTANAQEAGGDR